MFAKLKFKYYFFSDEFALSHVNLQIRKSKYWNNIVEQDHRFINWRIQQGLGFKEFESDRRTLFRIEIVRTIKKNQMIGQDQSPFKSFKSLAA